jgi:puromycin-sensitive aminopeptidase
MNLLILYLSWLLCLKTRKALSSTISPLHYELEFVIKPDTFEGVSRIKITSRAMTKTIRLNAQNLEVVDAYLLDGAEKYIGSVSTAAELLEIYFETQLLPYKEYVLVINYRGKYSDQMDGIYKSNYNGKALYSTHFEATSARKAFPCFDQPDMKATFGIRITAPEEHTVLSNTSLKEKKADTFIFNITKPMSTYLVAFVVGKLDYIQVTTKGDIPIRIYSDKSDIEMGELSLEVAKHTLEFFEKYFDIRYPFPKLDLIAIPEFAMGAMENWGLVTFRKTSLLYNKKTDATTAKLVVIETVCHELAHMWFGNLVTMRWWKDLWLNEGFATWAASMAVYNLPKELIDFDVWLNFINEDLEAGMEYDALHSSHPIAVEVNNPDEINQIFDQISYNKGASLIRMIENFVGHETFRKGIKAYLKYFAYNNAESDDLFSFQKNPEIISRLAKSWIEKEGFPLITVKETAGNLEIFQSRFLTGTKIKDDKKWIVPITIQFKNNKPEVYLLSNKSMIIPKSNDIYKLNVSNVGLYRTLYSKQTFEKIFDFYEHDKERLNIVNDLFALGFADYVDMRWVVNLFRNRKTKYSYEILKSIISNLRKLCHIYYDDPDNLAYLKEIINDILVNYTEDFDLEKDGGSVSDRLLNGLVLSNSLFVENKEIIYKLEKYYNSFKSGSLNICPDYTFSMLSSVVDDNLQDVIELAKTAKLSNIKLMAIRALGTVKDIDNLKIVLKKYTELDRQDISSFFLGLSNNLKYKNMIINYFINNYESIKTFTKNDNILNSSMSHIICGLSNPDLVSNIKHFLDNLKHEGGNRTIRKILESNQIYSEFRIKYPKIY